MKKIIFIGSIIIFAYGCNNTSNESYGGSDSTNSNYIDTTGNGALRDTMNRPGYNTNSSDIDTTRMKRDSMSKR